MSDLTDINQELEPLKALADRELASIYGLTGMVYTPYIDDYMQVSIKKAAILACLKNQGYLPLSEVEIITAELDCLHKRARSNAVFEYKGNEYKRRFSPLKLSKSGKNVQKWAKFWLLQLPNGKVDPNWERQVREIWPSYFLIRTINM
ncbi:hypothetical protein B5D82_04335 [Cognaticolwellia beringensis]|uniref:Uncharacterized protein n=2 Tax=Cognaticolwellia beringensis TaxID=1967665 RepID=A0A222GDK7_9GAMM|nr:hypothetical protein B5D82_04335 [Cognaticolwellia beringensis]